MRSLTYSWWRHSRSVLPFRRRRTCNYRRCCDTQFQADSCGLPPSRCIHRRRRISTRRRTMAHSTRTCSRVDGIRVDTGNSNHPGRWHIRCWRHRMSPNLQRTRLHLQVTKSVTSVIVDHHQVKFQRYQLRQDIIEIWKISRQFLVNG